MCANRIFYGTEAIERIEKNQHEGERQWLTGTEKKKVKKVSMWKISKKSFDMEALKEFTNLEIIEISGLYADRPLKIQNLALLYEMKNLKSIRFICCDIGEELNTSHWKKLKYLEVSQCRMEKLKIAKNRRLREVICSQNNILQESQVQNPKVHRLHGIKNFEIKTIV